MLDRLVVGTANWGRDYNGHCVDEKEQNLIMEYMKEVGIEWLDVAEAYGTLDIGKDFKRVVKTGQCNRDIVLQETDIKICHRGKWFNKDSEFYEGVSVDKVTEIGLTSRLPLWIEFPYSILNRNEGCIMMSVASKLIARSIFCKGKALKYFSPRECIDFVLMNPRIDKVILGVDSVDQLVSNVEHLVRMERFEHNEEIDTRKF